MRLMGERRTPTERELERRLREEPISGESGAQERAWAIAAAAHDEREPRRRFSVTARLVLVALGIAATTALALSPAGARVGDLVRDAIETGPDGAPGGLSALPPSGSLLVEADSRLWLIDEEREKRLLGDYEEASWSPRGLFVAATTADELRALEPDGDVAWEVQPGGEVSGPRWSPSGFRVAYLADGALRIVAGNGTDDRVLAEGIGEIAPSWRPPEPGELEGNTTGYGTHHLTYVAPGNRIRTVDTDTGAIIWEQELTGTQITRFKAIESVEWSAGGDRLLVRSDRGYWIFDRAGNPIVGVPREPADPIAISPDGARVALVYREGRASSVLLRGTRPRNQPNASRELFSTPGVINDVTWSADGEWLLISWRSGDGWVLVGADGRKVIAVDSITERFESEGKGFPEVAGWCCQADSAALAGDAKG